MVAAVVVALALGLLPGVAVPPTVAASAAGPACEGVVVVVDATALPAADATGPGFVACAARDASVAEASDGIEVLADAGVQVEGTAQWGAAFVCRVEGRPSATQEIPLPGGGVVTEACDRTPSTLAYWSLWTAAPGTGDTWTYAQTGVSDLELEAGAALGLVFSVGPDAPAPPALSVADARAGRASEGWTVRTSPDGAPPADETAAPAPARPGTDPLLLGAAAVLVVLLGAASIVLARRRR